MIRLMIASVVLLLALGGAAAAQTPSSAAIPALKADVTVTGDIVTIGDLVENAGPVANVPIFRAPDLGTTGAVATDRILDAIRPHQLIGIDTHGLAEVVVTRASRAIAAREISARIAQALTGQYGFGNARDILINFDGDVRTLQVEPNATGELRILSLSYDPRTTRFDVTFDMPDSMALQRQPARYTGTAIDTVRCHRGRPPDRTRRGAQASDLTTVRRPKAESGAVLTDDNAAIGLVSAARAAAGPSASRGRSDEARDHRPQRHCDHRLSSAGHNAHAARSSQGCRRARRYDQRLNTEIQACGAGRGFRVRTA